MTRSVNAQDFTSLSIEDLGELDVFSGSILDTHIHQKDDLMIALHHTYMQMNQMRSGTNTISTPRVLSEYMVSPIDMKMSMTMLHLMYAYSDNLTMIFATHYMDFSMQHKTRMGMQFTTNSKGMGDSELVLNYLFKQDSDDENRWIMHTALILPTGSIDEKDMTPMGHVQLPYAMQLGTGSYQVKLGVDYTQIKERYIISSQIFVQSPVNDNDAGYQIGEKILANLNYIYSLNDQLSLNFTLGYQWQNDISGTDKRLNPMVVPTAVNNNYGGNTLDAEVGISWLLPKKNKIGIHYQKVLWQNVHGMQLQHDWQVNLSWELTL